VSASADEIQVSVRPRFEYLKLLSPHRCRVELLGLRPLYDDGDVSCVDRHP